MLICELGYAQSDQVLPRDLRTEFPYIRAAPRAEWFDVVAAGDAWQREFAGGDVIVAVGRVGLLFDNGRGRSPISGHTRLMLPDLTSPSGPGIQWSTFPEGPEGRIVRWVLRTLRPVALRTTVQPAIPAQTRRPDSHTFAIAVTGDRSACHPPISASSGLDAPATVEQVFGQRGPGNQALKAPEIGCAGRY